jgi:diguanylate cyclase (GGDEF)-like protein/PAS domain S-box-containing protein
MALAAADIGTWEWLSGEGMIGVNDAWCRMIGYERQELDLSAQNWYTLVHPDDLDVVRVQAIEQASQSEFQQFQVEFRMRHKQGHWVWIQTRGKVLEFDAQGQPLRLAGAHIDISGARAMAEALKHAHDAALQGEARFRSLTELSTDWYWEQDATLRFVDVEGLRQPRRHRAKAPTGLFRWDLPALNMDEAAWAEHRATLERHETFRDLELLRPMPDSPPIWISLSGVPILGPEGEFKGYRGIGRDISRQKEAEETIRQLAFHDQLTRIDNRQMLLHRLQDELAQCLRDQNHAAVLFIDLDNFKLLNDTHGHAIGDRLLQTVADRLKRSVRAVDAVARLGGDEFVVLLRGLNADPQKATAQARRVGQKLLEVLNEPYDLGRFEHHCPPSMGAVVFGGKLPVVQAHHPADIAHLELLRHADMAMYRAKTEGGNRLRFFDPAMQAEMARRAQMEAELRHALANGEIHLAYQPIVDADRQVLGYEALARWQHPQRGNIPPAEFIPLAEETGLILPLGDHVLQLAGAQLAQWAAEPQLQYCTLSVNVSAMQFRQRNFVLTVQQVLERHALRPNRLKLELTESLLLNEVDEVLGTMHALRALGVGLALDDFGTGYSSLSYLKSLPLSQLKIDKVFVRDVLTDLSDAAIAVSILTLAQALDLEVVAEGVEFEGQMDFLANHGCMAFQGYLFGRPDLVPSLAATTRAAPAPISLAAKP